MRQFVKWLDTNHIAIIFTLIVLTATGGWVYTQLPKDVFPNGDFPRFQVIADIGFASLQETEINVTRPLEEVLKTVPDVRRVVSVSERGTSTIDVYLKWGADLTQDFQLTQNKINQVRGQLPANTDIQITRMNTSAFPMSEYGFWSDQLNLKQLYEAVRYSVIPKLIGIDGLYGLQVIGGQQPEIWIKLNPRKLIEYNLDPVAVNTAVSDANMVSFVGQMVKGKTAFFVIAGNKLSNLKDIGDIVVATRMGKPLMLKDIATIEDAHSPVRRIVSVNGHKGLFIDVEKQLNADGLKVSMALDRKLAETTKEFNGKLHIVKWDLSDFVRTSIQGILSDILIAVVIILMIVYFVMNGFRYALPIMCVLPVVIVIEFLVLKCLGMTVNIMTLGGLSAAIGIIADNAIVVTENYVHFKRQKKSGQPLADSLAYILPITVWATMVSIIIFIPLNILTGLSGMFFRPLAITLASTIIVSLFMAAFVIPVLIKYFIENYRGKEPEHEEKKFFRTLKERYLKFLRLALRRKYLCVMGSIVLGLACVFVFLKLHNGFLPEGDEGNIVFDYIAPAGYSIEATDALMDKVEKVIQSLPSVRMYIRKTGTAMGTPYSAPTIGETVIYLKENRKISTFKVMAILKKKLAAQFPYLNTDFHQILSDRLGDLSGAGKPVVVSILGNDFDTLMAAAKNVQARLEKIKGLDSVLINMPPPQKEIHVTVDQPQASLLGLGLDEVYHYSQLGIYGEIVSKVQKGIESIPIREFYGGDYRSNISKLKDVPIYTPNGGVLPLGRIAQYSLVEQNTEIHHMNGSIVVNVNAEISGRSLGEVIKDVKKAIAGIPRNGFTIELGGTYASQQTSFKELLGVLGISIVLILALLLFIFESYRTALAVFAGTVCSASFVILGLFFTRTEFDVSSFTGMIAVMGIVVNNGILVIDFVERFRREGRSLMASIHAACQLRFRPVLITNLSAMAGFLPMALNLGHGAEVLQPFSIAMISGLMGSMFFSLIVMPVFYYLTHHKNVSV
ncbi:MAG: efflux RND transporter permease subunit [Candidatus Omnitrophica bacterium]|nr:efflux RND transporter permease subunit [Candidatus Omnitrophota bacterium]MDE2213756.1 efflux RND transporter permease subunit [Candidatus Omnitrophota bacterium]MDE2230668.1 efflux RND transporter permease subunit [Candidatus Omnitrophota bacterium]